MLKLAALAAAALLLPAAAASAKQVEKVVWCGAQDCRSAERAAGSPMEVFAELGGPTEPPARAAPWYRVTITIGPENAETAYAYVPSAHRMLVNGGWFAASPQTEAVYAKFLDHLEPKPAATMPLRDAEPVQARVDEVVRAPAQPAGGGTSVAWLAGGAVAAAALALLALRRRRSTPLKPAL